MRNGWEHRTKRVGSSAGQEVVRILPQNGAQSNQERTESRYSSSNSRPEISAHEISGQGAAGTGDRETERPDSGRPRHERWRGHVRVVRPQSFLPLKEAKWRPETAKVKKLLIQKDLIDPFDGMPLESFDRFTLQVHLNKLAETSSKDRVLQIRLTCRIFLPRQLSRISSRKILRARSRPSGSFARDGQNHINVGATKGCASRHSHCVIAILLELDMTNALRPSELFALRWKSFNQAESKM